MDYYIYYRVQPEHGPELMRRVRAVQALLAAQFELAPLLRRRPPASGAAQTWMEVYAAVADSDMPHFEKTLAEAVAQFDLPALTEGPRHVECFMEFPPCA